MDLKLLTPVPDSRNLVLHYNLRTTASTGSTIFDYSLTGNTGTSSGTNIGPVYPGFLFNGTDDYINTGATGQAVFRNSFTVTFWCRPDDGQPASAQAFFGSTNAGDADRLQIYLHTTAKIIVLYTSDGDSISATEDTASFSNGPETWHQVAIVVQAVTANTARVLVYFDGALTKTGTTATCTMADYTSTITCYVGAYNNNGGGAASLFAGDMGDVRIYNALKTAEQIKSLYEITRGAYGV